MPDSPISQEGAGSGLSICFDSYQETGEPAPAIDLKNARTIVGSVTGIGPVFRQGKSVDVCIQVQMLFSPDFDLSAKTDVYLAYNSIYTQNQDSLSAVEYSIDQGTTWLPIIDMLDAFGTAPGGFDMVTNALGAG